MHFFTWKMSLKKTAFGMWFGKDFHLTGELIHPLLFKGLMRSLFTQNDLVVVEWRVLASLPTVDGQNHAPVDMVNIPLFAGFHTSQVVVSDFFHPPVCSSKFQLVSPGKAYTLAEKMVLWLAIWTGSELMGEVMPGSLPACLGPSALTSEANKALEALTLVAPNESEARRALAGLCKWAVQLSC